MDSKLITIAIHTYEKAQILKSVLESEGVQTSLENVNPEKPVMSAGVRVKIKETDLPKALRIVEDFELMDSYSKGKIVTDSEKCKIILVPVDFSICSLKAAEWAIRFAHDAGGYVLLMHSYYSPFYLATPPYADGTTMTPIGTQPEVITGYTNAEKKMKELVTSLTERMEEGHPDHLPKVSLHSRILQGVPEDIIIEVTKEMQPFLLVMGSRGMGNNEYELVGSVTADVIDRSRVPVLVVPKDVPDSCFGDISRVAFATSFSQKDLVIFDAFMDMVKRYRMTIYIFNISAREERSNLDAKTKEIREYFKRHYPHSTICYEVLKEGDRLEAIADFLENREIEMVALPVQRRNMLSRLFSPTLQHRMLLSTTVPMLVFNTK